MENQSSRFRSFLARKQIEISLKRYFVDAMGAMAFGLFASLLIGTIFDAIADQTGWAFLAQASEFCSAATGPRHGGSHRLCLAGAVPGAVLFMRRGRGGQ